MVALQDESTSIVESQMSCGDGAVELESSRPRQWSPAAVIWIYLAWILARFLTVPVAGPQIYYLVLPGFYLATAIFLARY